MVTMKPSTSSRWSRTSVLQLLLSLLCLSCWSRTPYCCEAFRSVQNYARTTATTTTTTAPATSRTATILSVLFRPDEDKQHSRHAYDDKNNNKSNNKINDAGFGDSYMPLDDAPLEITCDANFPSLVEESLRQGTWLERYGESLAVFGIPAITPFIAFAGFDQVAAAFHWLAEVLSSNNWVSVDGGAYQAKIIAPAINGVVVPSVALLLATLTSTTITTLRQRQLDVRKCINIEAAEIRAIECLLDSVEPSAVQDQCRDYLIQYTCRVLDECHPRQGAGSDVVNPRRGFDSELNGLVMQLNKGHGTVIPAHVAAECYGSLARLREQRSNRITALQSVYPVLHYAILVALTMAVMTAFLIETDQELLVFLNSFQLKILWSMLTGTFVACFAVFADLRAPFSGSYQVSDSVDQLHTIKWTLQASRVLAQRRKEEATNQKFEFSATPPPKEVARLFSEDVSPLKQAVEEKRFSSSKSVGQAFCRTHLNTTSTTTSSSRSNSSFE